MQYNMKVEKIESIKDFKIISRAPDIIEEEREEIKQKILLKLYKEFSDKISSSIDADDR